MIVKKSSIFIYLIKENHILIHYDIIMHNNTYYYAQLWIKISDKGLHKVVLGMF